MSTNTVYGKDKAQASKPEPAKEKLGVMIPGMEGTLVFRLSLSIR